MKKLFEKLYILCLTAIPLCSAFMLTSVVNSTTCWVQGQEELPAGAKEFRKF